MNVLIAEDTSLACVSLEPRVQTVVPTTLLHLTQSQADSFRWHEQHYGRNHPFLEIGNRKTGAYYLIDAAQQYACAPYSRFWIARQGYLESLGCRVLWAEEDTDLLETTFPDVIWNAGQDYSLIALPAEYAGQRLGGGYRVLDAEHPLQETLRRMDVSLERMAQSGGKTSIHYAHLQEKQCAIARGVIHQTYQMADVLAGVAGSLIPQINTNFQGDLIAPRGDRERNLYENAYGNAFLFAESCKLVDLIEAQIHHKDGDNPRQPARRGGASRRFRREKESRQQAQEYLALTYEIEDARRLVSFLKECDALQHRELLGILYWFLTYEDPEKQAQGLGISVVVFKQRLRQLGRICEAIELDRSWLEETWWPVLYAEVCQAYEKRESITFEELQKSQVRVPTKSTRDEPEPSRSVLSQLSLWEVSA